MKRSFFVDGPGRPMAYATIDVLGQMGYVVNLVVEREQRRRGMGRAVMEGLASWFQEQGCREWMLYVRPDNVPALALYQSLGMTAGRLETTWRVTRRQVETLPRASGRLEVSSLAEADISALTRTFGLIPGKLNRFAEHPETHWLRRLVDPEHPEDVRGGWMWVRPREGVVRSLFAATPAHARVLLEAGFRELDDVDELRVVTGDAVLEARLGGAGARVIMRTQEMRGPLPPETKTPGREGPGGDATGGV
ncbi:GNAT family N-acetyltransferase [Melittangium boletus DSM 14713]|uniref:GNAT family N-acetyltransferase n=2 Tax=Melittangium boletus TaxID=83453 RepID=A0A250IIG1_9BACT|nr:GNAT family N-acetyltransferase [Melittangium boletus DSM 14713]